MQFEKQSFYATPGYQVQLKHNLAQIVHESHEKCTGADCRPAAQVLQMKEKVISFLLIHFVSFQVKHKTQLQLPDCAVAYGAHLFNLLTH